MLLVRKPKDKSEVVYVSRGLSILLGS